MFRSTLIFLWLLCSNAFSQVFDLRFDHLSTEEGLTQNSIQTIIQDNDGYLWIATEDGLNRYDGYQMETFLADPFDSNSIISNYLDYHCIKDSEGNLWFTYSVEPGLSRYIGNGRFRNYKSFSSDSLELSCSRPFLEDKSKNIWITLLHNKGFFGFARINLLTDSTIIYPVGRFKQFSDPVILYNIFSDSENNFWMLTSQGLFIHSGDSISQEAVNLPGKQTGKFYSMTELKNHEYLLSTDLGLIKYDRVTKTAKIVLHLDSKNSEANRVREFHSDKNGIVWITFLHNGMYFYDNGIIKNDLTDEYFPKNKSSRHVLFYEDRELNTWVYDKENAEGIIKYPADKNPIKITNHPQLSYSVIDNKIRTIFESDNGNIFIGTEQKGISIYNKARNVFKWLINIDGRANSLSAKTITSIAKDNLGNLVLGLGKTGIDVFSKDLQKKAHHNSPGYNKTFSSISEVIPINENQFLVGTHEAGLFIFDAVHNTYKEISIIPKNTRAEHAKNIKTIFRDSKDRFWIGTSSGIYILNEKLQHIKSFEHGGSEANLNIVFTFTEYKNHVVAGTHDGVIIIDYDRGIQRHFKHDEANPNSLSHHTVFSLLSDSKGLIWAGTFGQGLNRIDIKNDTIKHYSIKDGLPNNTIYGILEDQNGLIWLSTGNGLSCFNPESEEFRNYSTEDGLPGNGFNGSYFYDREEGCFYLGSANGLIKFDPLKIIRNNVAPKVHLTAFNLLNEKILSENELKKHQEINITYEDNIFSFDYVGINLSSPGHTKYAYKLDGLSDKWNEVGDQRKAIFNNVAPGNYIFRVKACNEDGVWSDGSTYALIIISPPYWQTYWFKSLIILAVLNFLYMFYRYRLRQLKKIEKIRLKIAGDLHDEIGSNLGSIAMMSKILKRKFNPETLDKIFETSLKSSSSIRDIVWFINPENDDSKKIIFKMKSFCEDTLANVNFKFEIEDESEFDKLSLDRKRNIYLVLKESVHNIIKHAEASKVKIKFYRQNSKLSLEISDNGKGFEIKESSGTGLSSLQKRAKEIDAVISINSEPGKGTKITLELH